MEGEFHIRDDDCGTIEEMRADEGPARATDLVKLHNASMDSVMFPLSTNGDPYIAYLGTEHKIRTLK
jgi:hypothetical protein